MNSCNLCVKPIIYLCLFCKEYLLNRKIATFYIWTFQINIFFLNGGRRGHDRMVVWFTTTYAIGAYHHWCCEFESRSGRGVQHCVINFVSDLRQVGGFLRVLRFSPPIKLTTKIYRNWNIVESGVKHHQTNKHTSC